MNKLTESKAVTITPQPGKRGEYELNCEVVVPHGRDEVFEFFADAHQLERITPPWLQFQVLTPKPIEMTAGTLIDYKLRLHGIPVNWRTEISIWEPGVRFVDRQLKGPYRYWLHEHTFEDVPDGTRMIDTVTYGVPGGRLVHRLLVKRDLLKIFEFRQRTFLKLFLKSSSI